MTYPQNPPPTGPPVAQQRLRGRTPLRLGIIFLILGIAGIVVGGIVAFNGALKKVDSFDRISVPAPGSANQAHIKFGTGGYIAYYEASDANGKQVPDVPVLLVSASGTKKKLDTPYGGSSGGTKVKTLSYDYDGHKGVALWQFTISTPGTYTVYVGGNTLAASGAKIAFGRSIGKSTAIGGLTIVLGVLLLIAGIILLIIGLVKRSRSKKERDSMLAGTQYGGFGAPMAAGPPGYGQPPAPQQYNPPSYGQPQQGYQPPPPPQQQNPWPPNNES